jgi:LacI family transcriptional regulator
MSRTRNVTIHDVARKADVSIATVSYVINHTGNVGAETRKRVFDAIQELNYSTNAFARSLRTNQSQTLGVVAEDITVFNTPKLIDGINEYAEQHGYHTVLSNLRLNSLIGREFSRITEYRDQIRENTEILLGRRIDGLIYIGQHMRNVESVIDPVTNNIVYLYAYTFNEGDYCVNFDDRDAGHCATSYLLELGHRRIGIIEGLRDSSATQDRLSGYQKALQEHGVTVDADLIVPGDWEYEAGRSGARALLDLQNPPTAVFALNDVMAVGVIDECHDRGLNVPKDLSVMGFDDREFASFYRPSVTTMQPPLREMGIHAAKICISRAVGPVPEVHRPHLVCSLIERDSTAPPRH